MVLLTLLTAVAVTAGVVVMSKQPGTVNPFAPAAPTPADTLGAEAETVFADDGWSAVTLTRLSDVEDLLDTLEAHRFVHREVRALGNSEFRVRWK